MEGRLGRGSVWAEDRVQGREGGPAWAGVGLKDEGEREGAGGDGEEKPHRVFLDWGEGLREPGPTGCCVHRKALEMSCAIQNQLARILAEFEMTLERDVLQPLNRLSEVTPNACPQPPQSLPPTSPAHSSSLPTPAPGGAAGHPEAQEKPAEAGVRLEYPQEQVGATASGGVHA